MGIVFIQMVLIAQKTSLTKLYIFVIENFAKFITFLTKPDILNI